MSGKRKQSFLHHFFSKKPAVTNHIQEDLTEGENSSQSSGRESGGAIMSVDGSSGGPTSTEGESGGPIMSVDGSSGGLTSTEGESGGPSMSVDGSSGGLTSTDGEYGGPSISVDGSSGGQTSTEGESGGPSISLETGILHHKPECWSHEQFDSYTTKNPWLIVVKGKFGCSSCKAVKELKLAPKQGVHIQSDWATIRVTTENLTYIANRSKQQAFLRRKLWKHKESTAHKHAESILKTASKNILQLSSDSQLQEELESTKNVFRTAYYCAKENKPFSDFEGLIDLNIANSADMGRILHSRKVCTDIINHISSEMKKVLVQKIIENKSKICILIDESSRIGNKETLIVFVKASIDGVMDPISFPIDLIELEDTTSNSIKSELLRCLSRHGLKGEILQNQLIGFCSDGANAMLGSKSGVGVLFKEIFPNLFLWHCLNHRLELAVHDAIEKTTGVNEFKMFLDSLYAVFSNSNKNSMGIENCAKNLCTQFRKVGKIFTIRWVASSFSTVSAVFDSFVALANYLLMASEDQFRTTSARATFKGFYCQLTSYGFLKNLAIMYDVLEELSDLSLSLQKRNLSIHHAFKLIEAYISRIGSLKGSGGKKTQEISQVESDLVYHTVSLNQRKNKDIKLPKFIDEICDSMRARLYTTISNRSKEGVVEQRQLDFKEFFNASGVLYDESLYGSNPHYGEKEVQYLSKMMHLNVLDTKLAFVSYKESCGLNEPVEIIKLKTALNTISASNADCERGFSTMNNVITPNRNSLSTANAASLIFISQVGEPFTSWKPDRFVKSWLRKGRRAAYSKSCKKRSSRNDSTYYEPIWNIFR